MIKTAEELLGTAKAAEKQQFFAATLATAEAILGRLGIPGWNKITNRELEQLRPIYATIIRDMRANKENSKFLKPIIAATKEKYDAALILLHFLRFVVATRYFRLTTGSPQENFKLVDEANEIIKTPELQKFCRAVIAQAAQPSRQSTGIINVALTFPANLTSVISLNFASKKEQRSFVEENIYYGKGVTQGFQDLRNDLARFLLVNMRELSAYEVAQAINMQMNLLSCHYVGNKEKHKIHHVMNTAPQMNVFHLALEKVKGEMRDEDYLLYKCHLGLQGVPSAADRELVLKANPTIKEEKQWVSCGRKGCEERGTKQCSQCRLVSYCSSECQTIHWKDGGHKRECAKIDEAPTLDNDIVRAAKIEAMKSNPAFLEHNRRLAKPEFAKADFLIRHVKTRKRGEIVSLGLNDPLDKAVFRLLRQRGNPHDVYVMYEMLLKIPNTAKYRKQIQQQLIEEHGVDPITAKCESGIFPTLDNTLEFMAGFPSRNDGTGVNENLFDLQTIFLTRVQNKQSPDALVDYVAPPGGVFCFFQPLDRQCFRTARYAAKKSPWHLALMHNMLITIACTTAGRSNIRNQMQREYGLDPASQTVQNSPFVSLKFLTQCFMGVSFELGTDQSLQELYTASKKKIRSV